MDNTSYASRLRYLDADDVDDSVIDYDGLDVKGPGGDHIGNVDGFIVDADAARAYYVVVDSGGWFSSRRFLVPVGHARLDTADRSMRVDVSRDALSRYPEFDHDRFREFSDEDLRAFDARMGTACCPDETLEDVSTPGRWTYGGRRHYAEPDWWTRSASHERVRPVETTGTSTAIPIRDTYNEDRVTARDRDYSDRDSDEIARDRERIRDERVRDRDLDDVSPHLDGRAQPGDVLGIESAGERTELGDTAEDEDKRRRDALKRD